MCFLLLVPVCARLPLDHLIQNRSAIASVLTFLPNVEPTMPKTHSPEIVVTAVFCEPFTAANAIRELTQLGFEDTDIDLVGVLAGAWPNSRSLSDIGVPAEHASYYQDRFEDGGVLLVVRVRQSI